MAESIRKLFGTDGIRAIAGEAPLDPITIFATGLALAHTLRERSPDPKVILGRDTRESSPWIAATLAAGLRSAGARVESAGIVPTPAVAFLAHTHGFQAGVVISASHNPWQDNGIKLFGGDGFKLPDAVELAMEDEILQHASQIDAPDPAALPPVVDNPAFQADYIQFLIASVPGLSLSGLHIVADCANGAAAAVAPELFRRLGGNVTLLNIAPNGRNINDNCGALYPTYLVQQVKARSAAIGLTFDGDADRCMLAGARNNVINGDAILLMAARDLKARGLLIGNLVVATTCPTWASKPRSSAPASACFAPRSATVTSSKKCSSRTLPSAASSPVTSSCPISPPPATVSSPRSSSSISSPAPANPSKS